MACIKKLILGNMFKRSEEMLNSPYTGHLKPEKNQFLTKAKMSIKTQKLLAVKRSDFLYTERSTPWPDDCPTILLHFALRRNLFAERQYIVKIFSFLLKLLDKVLITQL